jgi:hypothetical protein
MKWWQRWGILLLGYPVVMWLVWLWLGVPERDVSDLLLSAGLAVAIVAGLTALVWVVFGGSPWRALGFVLSIMTITIVTSMIPSRVVAVEKLSAVRWAGPFLLRALTVLLMAAVLPIVLMGTASLLYRWRYWGAWAVLTVGVYVIPKYLVDWVPELQSLSGQTASLIVRFGAAYLIALATFTGFARYIRRMAGQPAPAPRV